LQASPITGAVLDLSATRAGPSILRPPSLVLSFSAHFLAIISKPFLNISLLSLIRELKSELRNRKRVLRTTTGRDVEASARKALWRRQSQLPTQTQAFSRDVGFNRYCHWAWVVLALLPPPQHGTSLLSISSPWLMIKFTFNRPHPPPPLAFLLLPITVPEIMILFGALKLTFFHRNTLHVYSTCHPSGRCWRTFRVRRPGPCSATCSR
jgi:hypothetical protein